MLLLYRLDDKAREWREKFREIEVWDEARVKKLLKSKYHFKKAYAKAENLAKEFFLFENMVKEGAKLLNQLGEKNKELVAENDVIKQNIKKKRCWH